MALVALLTTTLAVLGLGPAGPAGAAPGDKILIFWESPGHNADAPRAALRELATENGYTYTDTNSDADFTWDPANPTTGLGQYAAVVFVHTSGDVLNAAQQAAFEAFTRAGGGSMFIHYATWGGEPDWPFYQRLAGARSGHHPERAPGTPALPGSPPGDPATLGIIQATVRVSDTTSALTAGLPASATRWDEYYDWRVNPVNTVHTLVEVDERTYSAGFTGRGGLVHPVTWCQAIEGGRQWTTGLGHSAANWAHAYDSFNRAQIKLGMQYVAGDLAAPECAVPGKDVKGSWDQGIEWAGVTPWPILPINMALTPDGKVQSFGARKPSTGGCVPSDPLVAYSLNGNPCAPDQGGQFEFDVWDPATTRTPANVDDGLLPNTTFTDLFCSIAVLDPTRDVVYTAGGDDSLGGNAPNAGAIGVTSYSTAGGIRDEAPMNYPRWYPTATVMPNGDIVVQGGISSYSGGQPIITPERYSPTEGNGWTVLTGAANATAYSNEQKRWWYPRAWVAPNGRLYTISGSKVYEIDPSGAGTLTMLPDLPAGVQNQGALGNPIGATSTAVMYQPGKILQVGGGSFQNGGGGDGARAGFTVDLTTAGGTANPQFAPTQPMRYPRHWATSTILPDGRVLVTGGARQNASGMSVADGVAPAPEIWDPETGQWSSDLASYRHGRQYHSSAMLLPDGRVIMGGGGAPGPGPYTDVEFYSPDYLWNGDAPAARPAITLAPPKVAYGSQFQIGVTGDVDRVTMVRAGSVTHSFNNGQAFYEPEFSVSGSTVTIEAPANGAVAPPGTWMLYVLNADGTPSVAELVEIDPATKLRSPAPVLVDQFDVPRVAGDTTIAVPAGSAHLAPWAITEDVQLQRAISIGGLEEIGYRLNLGVDGALSRSVAGFEPGREYRISFKYARQNGVTVPGGATVAGTVAIGDLDATVTATPADMASATWGTYTATFVANASIETLSLAGAGSGTTAGLMIDNLVVFPLSDASLDDVPIHYEFEDGPSSTSVANTGTDTAVGAGTFQGTGLGFSAGVFGTALSLPGGGAVGTPPNDSPANYVRLPDNLAADATNFTVSLWARPDTLPNWVTMFGLGTGRDAFFLLQSETRAAGDTGLAATFKLAGNAVQERVTGGPANDLITGQWNHVVFTLQGSTGTLYLNGQQVAQRTDLTMSLPELGQTTQNFLGKSAWPDAAFDGLLDDVRLYRNALSGQDVTALYNAGTAVATTTTVTTTPASPSAYGAAVTVTASIQDSSDQPVNAGNAQLLLDGEAFGGPVAVAAGTASWPVGPLTAGAHTVVVRYLGASGVRGSEGTLTHHVEVPGTTGEATTTNVSVTPPSPSPAGATVTVTATVEDSDGEPAIGSAELWIDGARAGDAVFLGAGGSVGFPAQLLAPGDHDIEVRYSGSRGLQPSTGAATHTVSLPDPSSVPIHYRFDDSSGTSATNSGTDQTVGPGTLTGTASFIPEGMLGGAVQLPGGSSTVALPDNLGSTYENVTVSFWAKPNALATWVPLLNIGNGTEDYLMIQASMGVAPNGVGATMRLNGSADDPNRTMATGANNNLVVGKWTHVVFTLDGTTGTIYLDGVQRGQNTNVQHNLAEIGTTTDNGVGDNMYPDPTFNGQIDDLRFYPDALNSAQIAALYEERPGVVKATTTTVTATPPSPSPATAPVTVKATVTAQGATPTGQAQLVVDAADVGAPVALAADGTVTFPAQALTPGDHSIVVEYLGVPGSFAASQALRVHTVQQPVPPAPRATTTSVSTSPTSPSVIGTAVTVSATVKSDAGAPAPGSAELWVDGVKVGAGVTVAGDGSVAFPAQPLAVGDHAIAVKYLGHPGFLASEGSITHSVVDDDDEPPAPTGRGTFVDVAAGRLLDTRHGGSTVDGRFAGGGAVGAGSVVTLDVAGRGGVPGDATAAVLNVTVTEAAGDGYVTAWPCGTDRPEASSVNFPAGAAVPNTVFARLGAGGSLCLYTSAAAHLIVDVAGHLPAGKGFEAIVPSRLIDTRQGDRPAVGDVVRIPVRDAAGDVPDPGTAVAVNLTVSDASGPGYLTVWACDQARPEASSINYAEGQTVANAVVGTLSADGELCAWVGQSATHVIVDLNGWFSPGSDVATGNPVRVLDTRHGGAQVAGNTVVVVSLAGAGFPAGTAHALLNVAAVDPAGAGYITAHACGAPVPNASNVNFAAGRNAANAVIAPVDDDGNVCLFVAESATGLIVDLVGTIAGTGA